jgi:nucleotide-binding universal stress UspA family protein
METHSTLTLLVPVDGSKFSEQAMSLAANLAGGSGTIQLLRAVPEPDPPGYPILTRSVTEMRKYWEYEIETVRKQLLEMAHRWMTPSLQVEVHAVGGDPAQEILSLAEATGADLIVMASHGRGAAGRGWFGSVADRVARTASIPVAIVRADPNWTETGMRRPQRLVVPYDGSKLAAAAFPTAGALASRLNLPVHVVRVINPAAELWPAAAGGVPIPRDVYDETVVAVTKEARASLDAAVAQLVAAGVRADAALAEGQPTATLLHMIAPSDLVVLASHGRSGVRRWLFGSVAEKLLRMAAGPVILVPAAKRGISAPLSDDAPDAQKLELARTAVNEAPAGEA